MSDFIDAAWNELDGSNIDICISWASYIPVLLGDNFDIYNKTHLQ